MDKPFLVNRAWETRVRIRCLRAGLTGAGMLLLLASEAWAAQFTGGPSVRVDPNVQVEFKWITDVTWIGKVEGFDNPDGSGTPVFVVESEGLSQQHALTANVGGEVAADTGYFFRVTATDPTDSTRSFATPTPLPPFFTGAQEVTNVFVEPDIDSAVISWEANVIGYGSVVYGTTLLDQGPVEDTFNITNHAIELTGLSAGTTYQFRVSNKHAIDRNSLAEATGQFTTDTLPIDVVLTQPHADPRVIRPNDLSTLSVRALHQGQPVAGVAVWFEIDPGSSSSGSGTFGGSSSAQATSDANGVASVQMSATGSGLVHVSLTSAHALNSLTVPVVVR